MYNRSVFRPDTRNVGGRQTVIEHMLNHQAMLRNIKSSVKSRPRTAPQESPRKQRRRRSTGHKQSGGGAPKTTRVIIGKRRSDLGVDCSEPSTYHLSQKLSHYRKMRQKKQWTNFEQTVAASKQKMREYPTMAQRKKNPFDVVAHPPIVIRNAKPPELPEWEYDYKGDTKSLFAVTPTGKITKLSQYTPQSSRHTTRGSRYSSAAKGKRKKDLRGNDLKAHLLNEIVDRRLYRQEDLVAFFDKALSDYAHVDSVQLRGIVSELKNELFVLDDEQQHSVVDENVPTVVGDSQDYEQDDDFEE